MKQETNRQFVGQLRLSKEHGEPGFDDAGGLAGAVALKPSKPKLKHPRLYRVVMLNDDYTPMDFVVHVLELFFGMNREQATRTMLKVHTEGKAICGMYSRDIAETKAEQVNMYARQNEHPLMCNIEAVEVNEKDEF